MINSVNDLNLHTFLDFCAGSPMGAKTAAPVTAYGADSPIARAWLQLNEQGKTAAALSVFGGCVNLSAGDGADMDELAAMLKMIGSRALTDEAVCADMGFPCADGGAIMELRRYDPKYIRPMLSDYRQADIYTVLKESESSIFFLPDFDDWYVDVSHRTRHGKMYIAACGDGRPFSCAMTVALTDNAAVLGGVATLPECRGRGLAAACVTELCRSMTQSGRAVYVFCRDDKIGFYEKLGFGVYGRFSEIDLNGE